MLQSEKELLDNCPGSCGELARAINVSLPANAPMIALANAFAVSSVLRAGRLQCSKIQANSYHVIVALSGSGKTEAQKRAEIALDVCGYSTNLMGDFTSEAALLIELQTEPNRLILMDEFGRALSEMVKSSGYRGEALTTLFKIYSCSNRNYRGKSYAPSGSGAMRKPIIIERPMVSILGSSTPSSFFDGMQAGTALDGLLGRFMVWFSKTQEKESRVGADFVVPQILIDEANHFLEWPKAGGNLQLVFEPKEIQHENEKVFLTVWKDVVDRFRSEEIELKASMLARAAELYAKICIALTDASGVLKFEAARYARNLLFSLYETAWIECGELLGLSEKDKAYFAKREKLLSKIPIDSEITLTKLGELTRRGFSRAERSAILDDLIETGEVLEIEEPSEFKPIKLYRRSPKTNI